MVLCYVEGDLCEARLVISARLHVMVIMGKTRPQISKRVQSRLEGCFYSDDGINPNKKIPKRKMLSELCFMFWFFFGARETTVEN